MSLPSIPKECFNDIILFLDDSTLYNCILVNRYLCKLFIPIIWRDSFGFCKKPKASLINTLLACLNDEEELTYYRSIYCNHPSPLFEYGKFIKIIRHERCVDSIICWLNYKKNEKK